MAPEVRRLPPRLLSLLLLLALPIAAIAAEPPPNRPSKDAGKNEEIVKAQVHLLQELDRQVEEKRRDLARQEEELSALKRALEAAKQELVKEKEQLEALKKEAQDAIARRNQADDERLEQVAKVYGAMRPKEAAQALEQMEDDTAVRIIERLPNRTVGKLFDVMSKKRVRELTRRLEQGRPAAGAK